MVTSLPGVMQVFNITTSSTAKLDDTTYTFNLDPTTVIPATTGEIWIGFPDYDYMWEMPGFGNTHACAGNIVTSDDTSSWYTPLCTNTYAHKLILNGETSPSYTGATGEMLSLSIENVKSPSYFPMTKNFVIASFDTATGSYIDRSYGTASDDDLLTFTSEKF